MVEQQFPGGGAQANMLLPFFAQRDFDDLVNEKILIAEARRMGLKATDDDLRDFLRLGQLGQNIFPDGKFIGQEAYQDLVSRFGYTVPVFEGLVKDDIVVTKLRTLVSSSASGTDAEIRQQFYNQNTKLKFHYPSINTDSILKDL